VSTRSDYPTLRRVCFLFSFCLNALITFLFVVFSLQAQVPPLCQQALNRTRLMKLRLVLNLFLCSSLRRVLSRTLVPPLRSHRQQALLRTRTLRLSPSLRSLIY